MDNEAILQCLKNLTASNEALVTENLALKERVASVEARLAHANRFLERHELVIPEIQEGEKEKRPAYLLSPSITPTLIKRRKLDEETHDESVEEMEQEEEEEKAIDITNIPPEIWQNNIFCFFSDIRDLLRLRRVNSHCYHIASQHYIDTSLHCFEESDLVLSRCHHILRESTFDRRMNHWNYRVVDRKEPMSEWFECGDRVHPEEYEFDDLYTLCPKDPANGVGIDPVAILDRLLRPNPGKMAKKHGLIEWAIENRHDIVVDRLIESTLNFREFPFHPDTLLIALSHSRRDIAMRLLNDERYDVSYRPHHSLLLALRTGAIRVARRLVDRGADTSLLRTDHADILHKILVRSCEFGNIEFVKFLLELGADPTLDASKPLRNAAKNGHLDIVELLLIDTPSDPTTNENQAIRSAAAKGHVHVVDRLLKDIRVNPATLEQDALRSAVKNRHIDVVRLLLRDPRERVDPSVKQQEAIRAAAKTGDLSLVQLLLDDDRVDPSAYGNVAIRAAAARGNVEIVQEFLGDARVDPSSNNSAAIRVACDAGHEDVVR